MVQVAPHGIDNYEELRPVYAATGACVALWPTPDYGMMERKDQAINHLLLHELNILEHLVSGYGTATLPLPYSPGMATKEQKSLSLTRQPEHSIHDAFGNAASSSFRYLTPMWVEQMAK